MNDIQGYVARDNQRKEIIVALRGRLVPFSYSIYVYNLKLTEIWSGSIANALTDVQVLLVPFICPGVKLPCKYLFLSSIHPSWTLEIFYSWSVHTQRLPRFVRGYYDLLHRQQQTYCFTDGTLSLSKCFLLSGNKFHAIQIILLSKGSLELNCRTGTWLVSLADRLEKKSWKSPQCTLRTVAAAFLSLPESCKWHSQRQITY